MDIESIKNKLEQDKVENVVLQFYNVLGEVKEIYLNKTRFGDDVISYGFSNRDLVLMYGDEVYLKPILDTYQLIPWYIFSARFISRLINSEGEHYEMDMLAGLERAKLALNELGVELLIQPSIEYSVIENTTIDRITKDKGPVINIDTKEGKWNNRVTLQNESIFSSFPADVYNTLRKQIVDNLKLFGYDIESHYHSHSISQHKIVFDLMDPIKAALAIADMKYITKAIAAIGGVDISYMPYIFPYQKGNSMEIRIKGGFLNTEVGNYFVAGILDHIYSIMLFTNPSINSYRRLNNEGVYICYSRAKANGVAIEFKGDEVLLLFPDSSANPFLSYTAILAAGYDGIKRKKSLEYEVPNSPKLMSVKDLKERKIQKAPKSLQEVIESFQSDRGFLKDFIDSTIITEYLNIKQQELKESSYFSSSIEYEQTL